jgi:hypothetical protein
MPGKFHAASATSIYDRRLRNAGLLEFRMWSAAGLVKAMSGDMDSGDMDSGDMDEALKAGIGAMVCSVFILAIVVLALQALPVSVG